MQWIVERLVERIIFCSPGYVVGLGLFWPVAIRVLFFGLRKQFVGNAHLDIVGLTCEHRDRFVLCLPAEAGDGTVIAAAVGMARNAEFSALVFRRILMREDFAILNRVDQTQPAHR